ncbi:MAG: vitamin K epoxide reductase family protein [Fimbriimonas sp.]|nr:vitamin K epoxide reductase family protein [Fimbriimonas sp.]
MKAILLNRILLVLSFIGLFVAGSLSLEMYLNVVLPCGPGHGCAVVASDPSSRLFGILPVAYIGFAGYILFAGLAIARALTVVNDRKLVQIGFAASVGGAIYSVYLQYLSFFHIHAVCPYCLTSAITMVITVIAYAMLNGTVGNQESPTSDLSKVDTWLVTGLPVVLVLGLAMMASNDRAPRNLAPNAKIKDPGVNDLVTKDSKVFGDIDAPITVVEFADLCCPACQKTSPQVKEFVMQHMGKVRLVFKDFPLSIHPLGKLTATVSECAQESGRFWDFAMGIMGLQRQPESVDEVLGVAKSCGLKPDDIRKRLQDPKDPVYDRVATDLNLGHAVGVESTPTFFILAKSFKTQTAGPRDVLTLLNSDTYKPILTGNG